MRAEHLGDGDGVRPRDVRALSDCHIDDEVLDHGWARPELHRSLDHAAPAVLMQVKSLLVAGGVELLEISPQVAALLFVLDAGEYHLGAGNLRARISDVFLE